VIGRVVKPGKNVAGLLYYLFGPGRHNEHVNPRLVGGWEHPADLEPPAAASGRRDFRRLTGLLNQPVAALGNRAPDKYVWHCVIRAAPDDPDLGGGAWMDITAEIMHRTGLSVRGHEHEGVRWVAVHHGDNHVHILATLARQDGHRAHAGNGYYRIGEALRDVERKYGLREVIRADRTAPRRPGRAEQEKARRAGRPEAPRVALRRHVEAAAAAARTEAGFFAELGARGIEVRLRHSSQRPGEVTGYAVGLPGDTAASGGQVWYGGGKLAADLTLPKLRRRWAAGTASGREQLSAADRRDIYAYAAEVASHAAREIKTGHRGRADTARAAADVLTVAAEATGNPELRRAADALMRAARAPWGRIPAASPGGQRLRAAAYLLAANRPWGQRPAVARRALLTALIGLAQAVADLRAGQRRQLQALAARDAAAVLAAVAAESAHDVSVADTVTFPRSPKAYRTAGRAVARPTRRGPSPRPGRQGPRRA
jgi:hypothetical protein